MSKFAITDFASVSKPSAKRTPLLQLTVDEQFTIDEQLTVDS